VKQLARVDLSRELSPDVAYCRFPELQPNVVMK
jgi:hypothetical protein